MAMAKREKPYIRELYKHLPPSLSLFLGGGEGREVVFASLCYVPKLNITLELTRDDRYPLTSQLNHKIVYFRAIMIQNNGQPS